MKYLADTAAQGDGPLIPAVRLPVNGGDGRTGQIEAVREVIAWKGLDQAIVIRRVAAAGSAGGA